ncbi:type II toxin-antitoxin system RelE/ParE family toxin [Rhizobium sp. L1K21]|uniref:type II toxin-antitoxin system RelE/ParE family toxin n=1 Tax=Rhizobium sp. L1K21 TaxID=2954933 RepID=UPI0020931116|nr:type II toxin-antitoxin system RelE/ParE family toxin [Rhizobium sp. L1K21]MCO6185009.1 type II toxin-antitoxin system RelE/ParE family toxin [Rhizobium sp. L1K21]
MHVRFSHNARVDLNKIHHYIQERNPAAAERVAAAIILLAYQLENFPFLGRPGRVAGTREISIPKYPYFMVYTISEPYYVDIEAVLHGSQLYPPDG